MLNVEKKQIKTIQDYRHSIKLLKYHLKKQTKTNENLQYQYAKSKRKQKYHHKNTNNNKIYSLTDTVKTVCLRLKRMGLVLDDVFRMADNQYEGQINKEQFMKTVFRLKTDLDESLFNEMFYAIDTSLNGLISEDQFQEFSLSYGGGGNPKQLRKFQKKIMSKLGGLIIKKSGSVESYISKFEDPMKLSQFRGELKELGLSDNESMLMMKTFDPSHQGHVKHKVFISLLGDIKFKTEKEQENQEYQKGIQQLCVQWRQRNLNPIDIFEEADVDGTEGVSPFQLEQAFKKLMPGQTTFQVKKWVSMINLNNDNQITKDEFLNSIRCFYSLNQMSKFSAEYEKKHPRKQGQKEEESVQKIMKQLSIKIQDSGMTKKEAFDFIDFDKNGDVSKEEMVDGLKGLGLHVGFVGRVMSVFDRDSSGTITLQEWCHLLGQDIKMSEVGVPDGDFSDFDFEDESIKGQKAKGKKLKQKQNKQKEVTNKTIKSKNEVIEQKKQNKNKTVKEEAMVKKKTKKFAEDNIKQKQKQKQEVKESKNKTVPKKKQPKKKVTSEDEPEQQINIQNEINVDEIEENIAKDYKRNKNNFLKNFRAADPKKTNKVTMNKFYQCLQNAYPSASEEQKKQIFMKYCIGGSQIDYHDWLQEISDMYAQDVDEQAQEPSEQSDAEEIKKEEERQKQIKRKEKQKKIEREKQLQRQRQRQEEQNRERQQKKKAKKESVKKIPEAPHVKRGQNIKGFQDLLTLKILDKKGDQSVEKGSGGGYKLIDFIDEEGEHIQERKKYMQKAKSIKEKGKPFKDSSFPTELSSLVANPNQSSIQNATLIKWKHYSDLFENPKLFAGSIEPNDIRQGSLGNCYFLCALACLAEYTNMIQRLFQYCDIQNGYFLVWLCIDGIWKLIELDGYIPVNSQQTEPIFSKTTEEELWVILLEKAYAKAYGNYDKIVGGQPYEAIKDLSGGPGIQMKHDKVSVNEIWQKLHQSNKQQYMMTAGTKMQEPTSKVSGHQEGVTSQGMVLGHAYSILDLQQIKGERIIQLRNPWGQTQWLGEWSDKSSRWTDEMKIKLKYQGSDDDGIFWMPLNAFYHNFVTTSINYIRPTFYYRSYKQTNIRQIAIKITSSFHNGYLMVGQKDHRHQKLPLNTPYSLCHLIGFVYHDDKIIEKVGDSKFLYARQGSVQFKNMNQYPQGSEAILMISLQKSANVVVGYYGDKPADFALDNKCMDYLEKLAFLQENGPNSQEAAGKMRIWLTQVQGIGFLCFKNICSQKFVLKIDIPSPQNLKLVHPTGDKNVMELNPGVTKSLRGRVIDLRQGFNFNQQISFVQ